MKEIPIAFTTPMMKLIIDGSKTMTRRIMNPQPAWDDEVREVRLNGPFFWPLGGHPVPATHKYPVAGINAGIEGNVMFKAVYEPGDRLWVREQLIKKDNCVAYAATNRKIYGSIPWNWKVSSISPRYMPRWASRFTLEVVSVKIERLSSISEEDAIAEIGKEPLNFVGTVNDKPGRGVIFDRRKAFAMIWDSIHGDGAFAANPWVRAVTFKKVK